MAKENIQTAEELVGIVVLFLRMAHNFVDPLTRIERNKGKEKDEKRQKMRDDERRGKGEVKRERRGSSPQEECSLKVSP